MLGKVTKRQIDALKQGKRDVFLWDTELPGFGIKVTPAGRKVFLFQYRMGGRGFPSRRFTIGLLGAFTAEEARKRAGEILGQVRRGIDPMAARAESCTNSIAALVAAFIQSRADKGHRTVRDMTALLNGNVVAAWGDRPVASITRADVVKLIERIKDRGAPVLANRALSKIQTMFRWAMGRGLMIASPADGIEKPYQETTRDRVLTDLEMVEVWRASGAIGWPFGPAIQVLILTGQRREEAGGMRWGEVNLDAGLWTLPASRTKNAQPHVIHLAQMTVAILRKVPRSEDATLAFTTTGLTSISGWSSAKRQIDRTIVNARRQAAIDAGKDPEKAEMMPAWRVHDLRRSFTTGMVNLGIAPHVADRVLNHVTKSKGGVAGIYNKASYAREREAAMTLWAEHVQRLLDGSGAKVLPMRRKQDSA